MAIYNEILSGRFARALQKLFSMKGEVPTKQLSGEIMAMLRLDDLMNLEHRILLQVRSFARSVVVPAGGAGNRSAYRLRNPPNSGVIAVLEKFQFISFGGISDAPFLTRGPTGTGDLTTVDSGNVSIRDLRMGPINSTLALSQSGAATIVGVQIIQIQAPTGSNQAEGILLPTHEIVVAPGDLLTIYSNVVNQALGLNLMWRERALEESEASLN